MEFTTNSMFGVEDKVVVITGGCGGIGGSADALCERAKQRLLRAVRISDEKPEISPLIHQMIS